MRSLALALVAMLLSSFFLVACDAPEAASKIGQILLDPDTPVGEPDEQPSEIALHVYAAEDANPNFEEEPAPVILKIYALDGTHRFYGLDFFSLVEAPEEELGVTFKGNLGEGQVSPDSYKILGPYELPRGTRQIGVIAEFFDIESTTWRDTIDVQDIGADERLLLLVLEEEIRLIAEAVE